MMAAQSNMLYVIWVFIVIIDQEIFYVPYVVHWGSVNMTRNQTGPDRNLDWSHMTTGHGHTIFKIEKPQKTGYTGLVMTSLWPNRHCHIFFYQLPLNHQNQTTADLPWCSNDQPINGIETTNNDVNTSQTPGTALSAPEVHPSDRPASSSIAGATMTIHHSAILLL
jgi:hypothetical protein